MKRRFQMSARLFEDNVVFYQRFLKSVGLYSGLIDGIWGPLTDTADAAFNAASETAAEEFGRFDPRSEGHIAALQVPAQLAARASIGRIKSAGFQVKIISGTRSFAEQNELFKKGRFGNPGPKVTNAKGGFSNHNFGIAWDIGLFDGGKYLMSAQPYEEAALSGKANDLIWGGDWQSFKDTPHYQLRTGLKISEVRERFEKGLPYFPLG
jgi:peptidoglycan L-alanyl-D-glutamate endopeptidase CwlK